MVLSGGGSDDLSRLPMQVKTSDGVIDAILESVSYNEILFSSTKLPAVTSEVEFSVKMPGEKLGLSYEVSIIGNGQIVRHQQKGDQTQAAILIDGYDLRD